MGFSLRKLGRAIDPTSKSSPLGGVVRMAISAVPGGTAALEASTTASGAVRVAKPAPKTVTATAPTAANAVPAMPGLPPLVSSSHPGTMAVVGFAAAGLLLAYLLLRK